VKSIYIEVSVPRIAAVRALRRLWPGVVFSRLSPLHCETVPNHPLPGPRWLRVRPLLSGICGSDLHMVHADADLDIGPAALPCNQRMFLGHEVAGVVTEAGAQVTRFKPGARVALRMIDAACDAKELSPPCQRCAAGHYSICERLGDHLDALPRDAGAGWGDVFLAHESQLHPVPDDLSDDQAVLLEPAACALHAALRLPHAASRILVIGAGTIGLFAIMAAKFLRPDAQVSAMVRHGFQAALAREAGADAVVLARDANEEIARSTGARYYRGYAGGWMMMGGYDSVLDCVGSSQTVQSALRWTKSRGTVVVLGVNLRPRRFDYSPVWYQEVDLIGSIGHGAETWDEKACSTFDLTEQMFRSSAFPVGKLITHRFALDDFRKAIATASDKKRSGAIKVVFDFRAHSAAPPSPRL
jgi:threonine dehydrogenase-like Zn-dependent dehydrogenase